MKFEIYCVRNLLLVAISNNLGEKGSNAQTHTHTYKKPVTTIGSVHTYGTVIGVSINIEPTSGGI